jgi:DNA mismatch repair protein MutL
MDALGQGGVPQLQLQPEAAPYAAAAPTIPGVLAGGTFASRWAPPAPGPPAGMTGGAIGMPAAAAPGIRPMIPLGQFRDTFIIAIDDEGIAIIDQHVAHERVLFERVMERLTAGQVESQRLLLPLLIEMPPAAHQALVARTAELERLGFEIEAFGSSTIKVGAVPALLAAHDSAAALRALAEDLEGLDRGAHIQEALRRIAATTACHAAVKANDPLTYEKMAHILEELRATAYSTVCPHGRPVMLRLTRREIEKNFERI